MTHNQALAIYNDLKGLDIPAVHPTALAPSVRKFVRVMVKASRLVEYTGGRLESRQIAALCLALIEDKEFEQIHEQEYQGPHPGQ